MTTNILVYVTKMCGQWERQELWSINSIEIDGVVANAKLTRYGKLGAWRAGSLAKKVEIPLCCKTSELQDVLEDFKTNVNALEHINRTAHWCSEPVITTIR